MFDVLFVDEAWQLPHHLFDRVAKAAPITVGVGDAGQLPPLEIGANPWRGDPGFNPYRAWPTDYDNGERTDDRTIAIELPAVWRPAAGHLHLWRAFYPEWRELNCVAAPGDRALVADRLTGHAADIWHTVGTSVPTLLRSPGCPSPRPPTWTSPLLGEIEALLDALLGGGFAPTRAEYDDTGTPTGRRLTARPGDGGDPLITVLATRNQAVDDATDMVDRLRARHSLTATDIVASTVDSWQGQTNGITVAIHPLSGAGRLDEFNSSFGRLAVTCTRATHGLLMVTAPASPNSSATRPPGRAPRSASPAAGTCPGRPTSASSPPSPPAHSSGNRQRIRQRRLASLDSVVSVDQRVYQPPGSGGLRACPGRWGRLADGGVRLFELFCLLDRRWLRGRGALDGPHDCGDRQQDRGHAEQHPGVALDEHQNHPGQQQGR